MTGAQNGRQSERLRRLVGGAALGTLALLGAMIAVTAGAHWLAYAIPVILLALIGWLWGHIWGWAWIALLLCVLATVILVQLLA